MLGGTVGYPGEMGGHGHLLGMGWLVTPLPSIRYQRVVYFVIYRQYDATHFRN